MSISSGLFVPSILIGAGGGRCIGLLLNKYVEFIEWGDVGKYALIGAVAQLAGVVRLSFSLTAIVVEATGRNELLKSSKMLIENLKFIVSIRVILLIKILSTLL